MQDCTKIREEIGAALSAMQQELNEIGEYGKTNYEKGREDGLKYSIYQLESALTRLGML